MRFRFTYQARVTRRRFWSGTEVLVGERGVPGLPLDEGALVCPVGMLSIKVSDPVWFGVSSSIPSSRGDGVAELLAEDIVREEARGVGGGRDDMIEIRHGQMQTWTLIWRCMAMGRCRSSDVHAGSKMRWMALYRNSEGRCAGCICQLKGCKEPKVALWRLRRGRNVQRDRKRKRWVDMLCDRGIAVMSRLWMAMTVDVLKG